MCAIAGIVHFDGRTDSPEVEDLRAMISRIRHRGPEEFGCYRDHHTGLVHARLALIDIATGQQPLSNEDGTLWIAFNGEIYNYIELAKELEKLGHRFRTHSDTEVVVHAYEAWGNECFSRFNGDWAAALWDRTRRRLVLSRDRIGVRPLFLHRQGQRLWFASEVKALFALPVIPREFDPRGMEQTFTSWAPIAPVTPFRGIEEIPPACIRTYDREGILHERIFWQPSYPCRDAEHKNALSLPEATEALREKLERATTLRMLRADVPVGSYLSGGLDSSLTARLGRRAKQGDFRTFSLRFSDAEFDETEFQRAMAATLDSAHVEVCVSRADIARVFPAVVMHAEKPILRTAPAPMYLLSEAVRSAGIKAVLTGEGADEMFGGYDIFREAKIREFWARQPESRIRPRLFERIYPYLARSPQHTKGLAQEFWRRGLDHAGRPGFSHEPRWTSTSGVKRFFSQELRSAIAREQLPDLLTSLPSSFNAWDQLAKAQYLEIVTLLSPYLISSQGDRMLMAHSVEGRFPFLDVNVMEFANGLPPAFKLCGLSEKHILKRAAEGMIPATIIQRQKQPYRAPDAISFLLPEPPEYVREAFSEDALRKSGLFDVAATRMLFNKCIAKAKEAGSVMPFSNTDNMSFVGILSSQLLHASLSTCIGMDRGTDIHFTTEVDALSPRHVQRNRVQEAYET
ncbi:MAG: asparagine synthase (glutamine-hydrolyzing) [Bacteroidetes bacterium]|nr:asparagine synthase (glutamine-hydrolyzing) [Bacteroidota bacterium]